MSETTLDQVVTKETATGSTVTMEYADGSYFEWKDLTPIERDKLVKELSKFDKAKFYYADKEPEIKPIDFKSAWYKNCVRNRRNKANICYECPFKEWIEYQEKNRC